MRIYLLLIVLLSQLLTCCSEISLDEGRTNTFYKILQSNLGSSIQSLIETEDEGFIIKSEITITKLNKYGSIEWKRTAHSDYGRIVKFRNKIYELYTIDCSSNFFLTQIDILTGIDLVTLTNHYPGQLCDEQVKIVNYSILPGDFMAVVVQRKELYTPAGFTFKQMIVFDLTTGELIADTYNHVGDTHIIPLTYSKERSELTYYYCFSIYIGSGRPEYSAAIRSFRYFDNYVETQVVISQFCMFYAKQFENDLIFSGFNYLDDSLEGPTRGLYLVSSDLFQVKWFIPGVFSHVEVLGEEIVALSGNNEFSANSTSMILRTYNFDGELILFSELPIEGKPIFVVKTSDDGYAIIGQRGSGTSMQHFLLKLDKNGRLND